MDKISIIVPCYNEEKAIPLFYKELQKNLKDFPKTVSIEILFINDDIKIFYDVKETFIAFDGIDEKSAAEQNLTK